MSPPPKLASLMPPPPIMSLQPPAAAATTTIAGAATAAMVAAAMGLAVPDGHHIFFEAMAESDGGRKIVRAVCFIALFIIIILRCHPMI